MLFSHYHFSTSARDTFNRNDTGLMATVAAGDAARAHILTLRALIKPDNNAHGETFYIVG